MSSCLKLIPVSAVVPTMDRTVVFRRALDTLTAQGTLPSELIVIDASTSDNTRMMLKSWKASCNAEVLVVWQRAEIKGAAVQRNQGVALATQPFICFFDDDILFELHCMERLWNAIETDVGLGGVSAMITNQSYHPPGIASTIIFSLLSGTYKKGFPGRVLGPAVNLLPEDRDGLPEVVATEWLNLGCTIYRREALPEPPFDSAFTGYSVMEDLTLSVRVSRNWRLANVRTARIYHDSQPGTHKSDTAALAEMELVNRHYVMANVLKRTSAANYAGLILWETFQLLATRQEILAQLRGKLRALKRLLRQTTGTESTP